MSIVEHLDADALTSIASHVADDDVLAVALCARTLRAAQVAAGRKLKTKLHVVHCQSAALHLWAKSLGAPQPLSNGMLTFSGFFNSLRIERGYNWALHGKTDASHLQKSSAHRELSEKEYNSVAYPGPTIAFAHEDGKYVNFYPEDEMTDEVLKRDGLMYPQEKGFFTVRDVCEALAEYESGNITHEVTRRYDWLYLGHLQCCGFEHGSRSVETVPVFHGAWHGFGHPTDSSIMIDHE